MAEIRECSRCGKTEEQERIFGAIDSAEVIDLCESCAKIEGLPLVRQPNTFQLKEAEKPYTVYQRLSRMAGVEEKTSGQQDKKDDISDKDIKNIAFSKNITLDDLRNNQKTAQTEQKIQAQKKAYSQTASRPPIQLVDNFHWMIQRARRKLGITKWQLAEAIGESEAAIKMIEQGTLPEDDFRIINKIETYLKMNIQKQKQIQLPENGPARVLNFNKESMNNITIADLQKMKQMREQGETGQGNSEKTKELGNNDFDDLEEYEEK